MEYYKRIQTILASDLPLGDRYPKAKRKLSDQDIQELDKLFHALNKAQRGTDEWNELTPKINKLLGFECVGEVEEDEAESALMTESDKFKKFGPVVKVFKSSSNPNKSYEVRKLKGEEPTCNCPGWANRRKCKHVDEVKRLKIAASDNKSIKEILEAEGLELIQTSANKKTVTYGTTKPSITSIPSIYLMLRNKYGTKVTKKDGKIEGNNFIIEDVSDQDPYYKKYSFVVDVHMDDMDNKITAAIEVSPVNRPKKEEDSVRDILDRYMKKQAKSVVAGIERLYFEI